MVPQITSLYNRVELKSISECTTCDTMGLMGYNSKRPHQPRTRIWAYSGHRLTKLYSWRLEKAQVMLFQRSPDLLALMGKKCYCACAFLTGTGVSVGASGTDSTITPWAGVNSFFPSSATSILWSHTHTIQIHKLLQLLWTSRHMDCWICFHFCNSKSWPVDFLWLAIHPLRLLFIPDSFPPPVLTAAGASGDWCPHLCTEKESSSDGI